MYVQLEPVSLYNTHALTLVCSVGLFCRKQPTAVTHFYKHFVVTYVYAPTPEQVQEETGYDARGLANEKDFLSLYINGQQTTMYIVVGVDETFPFEPQVRKEISAIEWFPLDALPKGSFGVEPFVPRLRRWMAKSKGVRAPKNSATPGE